ncbi:UbiA family prenyltransferase [Allorhodopirellula solitaria]|uniref:Prenyltransferase n=1 Tax=Allorhodopirellula solitaria TaxID=2527987 RepID=A0A5C5X8L0_9BACT|nr:UbiA family prenyltransferase [Allorhodopirellula solitaria]TWT59270.1 prenyltransferase [Allorhodopirellula solitaria]
MNTAKWKSWAELVRLPNVFTVIADISAAFLLVLGGSGWYTGAWQAIQSTSDARAIWTALALALIAGVSLYWAGMILNDVFDLRRDVRARRGRPLARRAISVGTARCVGWSLLFAGVAPPLVMGLWCDSPLGWIPTAVAVALCVGIVLYDGPLKRTPLAPLLMGACRTLSFLLGATSANAVLSKLTGAEALGTLQSVRLGDPIAWGLTPVVLSFAIGMGTYIAGITTFGRREAVGDRSFHLPVGLVMMVAGAIMLSFAPRMAGWPLGDGSDAWMTAWRVDPVVIFPTAILLMLATALYRGFVAAKNPSPERIGATIGSALMAIIPISATITMLAVGPEIAILVFALLIPSRVLAARFRMT